MNYRQGFKLGLKSYSEAVRFIFKNKLGWYFLFPLLLNVLLFAVGFYSAATWGDQLVSSLNEWMGTDHWDFWGASVLAGSIEWLVWIMIRLLFFLLYAYFGGYIILILLSPVFAFLSEQTETILTGRQLPFNLRQFLKDIRRGVLLAIRNMTIELLITLGLFIVSFIPLVGYFTAIVLFLVSAYFYGFSFIDYTLERQRLNISHSVRFIRSNKGLAIGNGLVFCLVLMIPFIGVSLAGFASIISVVSATISANKVINDETLNGY